MTFGAEGSTWRRKQRTIYELREGRGACLTTGVRHGIIRALALASAVILNALRFSELAACFWPWVVGPCHRFHFQMSRGPRRLLGETSWELRAWYHPAQWLCQFENHTEWNGSCERPRVVDATHWKPAVPWRCRRETCFRDRTGPRSALFSPPLVQVATVAREDSRSCELSKDRSLDIVRR